jgi:[NiFe] hydrogenase diaphorase moiety large subunit
MLASDVSALNLEISTLVNKFGKGRQALLPILQHVQRSHGYISDHAQQEVARLLQIHPVEVDGVVTFYAFLRTSKRAKYHIRLCQTISCDLQNKEGISKTFERELGIKFGEVTRDEKYSLEYINCLGMCDHAPAMLINNEVHTDLTPRKVVEILNSLK